jgi:hypothetical protein
VSAHSPGSGSDAPWALTTARVKCRGGAGRAVKLNYTKLNYTTLAGAGPDEQW